MAKETKEDKAERLVLTDRIRFKQYAPTLAFASVRGDSGDYSVWRDERGKWACDCLYGKHSCSHILAVRAVYRTLYGHY